MKIRIRSGQKEDLKAVYQLVYELAVYAKESEALTASIEDYEKDFAEGCFETIIAEMKNEVMGMALYYPTYSTWKGKMIYLEDFVVKEAYRGTGVGQLLFDRLLEEARKKGARLVKWQVLDWNTSAIGFYEKNEALIEKGWWNCKVLL